MFSTEIPNFSNIISPPNILSCNHKSESVKKLSILFSLPRFVSQNCSIDNCRKTKSLELVLKELVLIKTPFCSFFLSFFLFFFKNGAFSPKRKRNAGSHFRVIFRSEFIFPNLRLRATNSESCDFVSRKGKFKCNSVAVKSNNHSCGDHV